MAPGRLPGAPPGPFWCPSGAFLVAIQSRHPPGAVVPTRGFLDALPGFAPALVLGVATVRLLDGPSVALAWPSLGLIVAMKDDIAWNLTCGGFGILKYQPLIISRIGAASGRRSLQESG